MKKLLLLSLLSLSLYSSSFNEEIHNNEINGTEFAKTVVILNDLCSDIVIKYSPNKRYMAFLYKDGYEFRLYDLLKKELIFALAPLKEMKYFFFKNNSLLIIKYGRIGSKVGYNIKTGKILWKNTLFGIIPRRINKDGYYIH